MKLKFALASLTSLFALCACDKPQPTIFDQVEANKSVWLSHTVLVSEKTWEGVRSLECRPTQGQLCGPAGCSTHHDKLKIWQVWEPATNKFSRCDDKGCDTYDAEVSYSGMWATVSVPGRATFTRLTADGEYYEVVTQMDLVYIYRGKCERR